MLVTAEEFAQVGKLIEMGLTGDELTKGIGEIISVPWPELALPLHYKIDPRAPSLRFDYHTPKQPPENPGPAAPPTNIIPFPHQPTGLAPARIHLTVDYDDLELVEAIALLTGYAR